MVDQASLWKELDEEGEDSVREKLAKGLYGHPGSTKRIAIDGWLEQKERQRGKAESTERKEREEVRDEEARRQARFARRVAIASLCVSILTLLSRSCG